MIANQLLNHIFFIPQIHLKLINRDSKSVDTKLTEQTRPDRNNIDISTFLIFFKNRQRGKSGLLIYCKKLSRTHGYTITIHKLIRMVGNPRK